MTNPKVEIQYLSPDALRKAQARALDLFRKDNRLCLAADKALKDSEVSAKELGEAFLKVKRGCKHGEFKSWFKRFEASANRVNYCMRVAEGKVGKPVKPNPLRDKTKTFTIELKHLYRFARDGDKENGEKLMVWMYRDLQTFWKENYTEPIVDLDAYREKVDEKVYELRLKKKRCTENGKRKVEREIKKLREALAAAERRADPENPTWTIDDDPPPDAIKSAAAAAGGTFTK
jgi:hypothetical protein